MIQDDRTPKDFTKTTFSGYNKPDVVKAFEKNLVSGNAERACFWTAELVCSGKAAEVWERLICIYSQHAFKESPKGALLLANLIQKFRKNINGGGISSDLDIRNDDAARRILGMATSAVAALRKGLPTKRTRVQPTDLELSMIPHRLQATSTKHATCFQDRDPKELFIASNELSYALHTAHDTALSCYWVEWIIAYCSLCKKRKVPIECATRATISGGVRTEDPAWLIWDVLLHTDVSPQIRRILDALLAMFRLRYQLGSLSKRVQLVYSAIAACSSNFRLGTSLSELNESLGLGETSVDRLYSVVAAGAREMPVPSDKVSSASGPGAVPAQKNIVATLANVDLLLSTAPFGPGK